MFGTFFEQSVFVYVITAIGVCGIMARLVMNIFLGGLTKNVDKMETTRKKQLVEIRKRYEGLMYLETDIRDTRAFAEKYIYRLRLGKIPVSVLESFVKNMMILSGLTGLVGAWWEYKTSGMIFAGVELLIFGIVVCGIMMIANNIFDCEQKKLMLVTELESYLSNGLANKIKREVSKQENAENTGTMQAAASVIEPNVIDIDKALGLEPQISVKEPDSKKLHKRGKESERKVSQAQIDACDALFDNLLKGISTT